MSLTERGTEAGYAAELAAAIEAARTAGALIRQAFGQHGTVREKAADHPVTGTDLAANAAIGAVLRSRFPADGWLSEESAGATAGRSGRTWVVDPLDGTKEFIMGIPELCVSVALLTEAGPVLGVVYNPLTEELFTGRASSGIELNGRQVTVTATATLQSGTSVLASRSETSRGEWERFTTDFQVRAVGSVAYKLALVAAGRADATFTLVPKSEWDVCAGCCLVSAGGGRVTDPEGEAVRFNRPDPKLAGLVATNGRLHAALLERIRARGGSP